VETVPYSTCEVAGIFVFQVTIAPELVILNAVTLEITGPVGGVVTEAAVVKIKSVEIERLPDTSALSIRK